MIPKVLITGGGGFIGSHTADLFLKKGYKVRILDNLTSKNHNGNWPEYLDKRIEKIKGDVRYKKHWLKALEGVDCVVHLAAWMDLQPEFSKFFSINTVGTSNLYEVITANKLPIKKIVIASSQFVYGQGRWQCSKDGEVFPTDRFESDLQKNRWDPICPICKGEITPLAHLESHAKPRNHYALSKYTQELIGLTLGSLYQIPTTALRYSIVHGPRQSLKNSYSGALRQFFLWLTQGNSVTVYEDGLQLRDFVSVYDVAEANLLGIESDQTNGEVFNVGGGKAYTVIDLANIIGEILGKKVEVKKSGFYRPGDTRHSFSDITKLGRLGWRPTHSAKENVHDFVVWAKQQDLANISVDKIQKNLQKTGALRKST